MESNNNNTLTVPGESDPQTRTPSPGRSVNTDNDNAVADEKAIAVEEEDANRTLAPKPKPWIFWTALSSMLCCAFLYGLDTTIAADVQASIYESLGEISKIAWVGVGFPLGSAGTILPIGMAFGKFNQKTLFLISLVIFEVGSTVCGAAPSMDALIWGRVIAGIGGSGIYLGGLNFVTVYTTAKERSIYTAFIGLVWAVGTVLGPVIGGGFASSSASWRWAFYINVCLFALIGPANLFCMPPYDPRPDLSLKERFKKMDWVGSVLIAGVFVTFILAFSLAGNQWDWDDGRWIAMMVVFGILLISFCVQQAYALFTTRDEQIFPVWFLKRRSMVLFYITMAGGGTCFFVLVYYLPLYFQFAHSDSAIKAAVRLLPAIVVAVSFIMLQGGLLPVIGYYSFWYILSGIFIVVGGCVMHIVEPDTPTSRVYGFSVILAIGVGLSGQGGYALAAAKARNMSEINYSVGFMNIAQIGSVAIALCVSGQIFQSSAFQNLSNALAGKGFTEAQIRDAIAGTKSAVLQSGDQEVREAAVRAITHAIDKVYIQVIACGAMLIVCGVLMKWEKLKFTH